MPFNYDLAKPEEHRHQARRPGLEGRARLLGRPRQEGPRRHAGPVHHRLHLRRGRRQLRHLRLGGLGSRLPDRRRRRQGRRRRAVRRRSAAAVGRGQPGLGQLGRLGLRGDHAGDGQEAGGQGRHRASTPTTPRSTDGWKNADHLPAQPERADVGRVRQQRGRRSSTARQANKEVYVPAENAYKGFTYSPFRSYYYAQLTERSSRRSTRARRTGDQAADDLQAEHGQVRQEQGFTVTE